MNITALLTNKQEAVNTAPNLTFQVESEGGGPVQHLNVGVTPEEFATFTVGKSYSITIEEVADAPA